VYCTGLRAHFLRPHMVLFLQQSRLRSRQSLTTMGCTHSDTSQLVVQPTKVGSQRGRPTPYGLARKRDPSNFECADGAVGGSECEIFLIQVGDVPSIEALVF